MSPLGMPAKSTGEEFQDAARRLRDIMVRSFLEVCGIGVNERVETGAAAYISTVGSTAEASLVRGVYPQRALGPQRKSKPAEC